MLVVAGRLVVYLVITQSGDGIQILTKQSKSPVISPKDDTGHC